MRLTSTRRRLLASTMICGAAFAALAATPAAAQDEEAVQEVVVTGSRIARQDYVANSPIVTVGSDAIEEIGTSTIETYLNSLPQLSPSLTKTNNNPSSGGAAFLDLRQLGTSRTLILVDGHRFVPGSSNGAVDVSVLPSALIDRVEVVTGGASAVYGADAVAGVVNFILKKNFEGLEVSGQYGVSSKGDGAEMQFSLIAGGGFADGRGHATLAVGYDHRDLIRQTERSFSQRAEYCGLDGCVPNGSATTGDGTFSLTGTTSANLIGLLETLDPDDEPISATCTPTELSAQLAALAGIIVVVGNELACFEEGDPLFEFRELLSPGQRLGFNPDQSLFIAGAGEGVFGYTGPNTDGWDPNSMFLYNFNPVNLIQAPLERYKFYTSAEYDITDRIQFYGDAAYANYRSFNTLAESPAGFPVNVATAVTLNEDVRDLLLDAGINSFGLARRTIELGPRTYSTDYSAMQLTGGLRGELPTILGRNWDYDIVSTYGRYSGTIESAGFPHRVRINAALAGCPAGSPAGPVGSSGSPTQCVPFNPFGAGSITQAQREYIEAKGQFSKEAIDQRNLVAAVSGELMDLPAGPVGFAAGIEYRDIEYSYIPPEGVQTGALLGGNSGGPIAGGYDVHEVFGELRVPLLADLPMAESLVFEGGYRQSEYSLGPSTDTWKYGGEWSPVDGIRFRAMKQQAVRAPSVGELFATQAEGFPTITAANLDPCDTDSPQRNGPDAAQVLALCQLQSSEITADWDSIGTQYRTLSGGNTNLAPETAESETFGVVIQANEHWPDWAQSLSVTVDYWRIEIEDVISSIGFDDSLERCFSADFNPTFSNDSVYCQAIHRDAATGNLTNVGLEGFISQQNDNLSAMKASGVDITVAFRIDLEDHGLTDWGTLDVSTQGTFYDNYQEQSLPGDPFEPNEAGTIGDGTPGDTTLPEWKFMSRAVWNVGDYSLSLRWLFIDEVIDREAAEGDIPGVEATSYFYLNGSWQVNDTVELFGGVDNLMDTQPPIYSSGFQYNTDPSTYDVIGRYYYMGIRARF